MAVLNKQMNAAADRGRNPVRKKSTKFSLSLEMSRLTRDGTAEPVSRDQILRRERGQGNIHFPGSADHVQDWQPYPVDPYYFCNIHVQSNFRIKIVHNNNFSTRLPVLILNSVFGEAVPLFHIQPGSEYYNRQLCTSKAAGVGPRCIETRSLAAGLGHRWSS